MLENNEIYRILKKIKFRIKISILIYLFCSIFGFFYLIIGLSTSLNSELMGIITIFVTISIFLVGVSVLYLFGMGPKRILFYYNMIRPLQLNHINLNSKYLISIKDQIYIMFTGFANGIYFIDIIEENCMIDNKPKNLPKFIIKINKVRQIDNLKIKFGVFSGNFKIPQNKGEFLVENVKVYFMPLTLLSKTQNTSEYVIKMLDIIKEEY